jgi:RNA recognition motif-containing protein
MASIQAHPKRTVYVHNLPDKIKDEGFNFITNISCYCFIYKMIIKLLFYLCIDLRRSLYGVFSQFGGILEVVTRKTIKTRGQAWIVFQDVASAANAIRQMDSFLFYDKLLVLFLNTFLKFCYNFFFCKRGYPLQCLIPML